MKVLIACEFSGVVREAFRRRGHEAWSCDILPCRDGSPYHYREDVQVVLKNGWDLIVAHPPCTYLTVSANRWYADKPHLIQQGVEFATQFFDYADKVCIENPVGRLSTLYRKPDQYIQPWMFGHKETKKTGLWLKNLPLLVETDNVYEEMMKLPKKERNRIHYMPPSEDRGLLRSVTFQGIADAMADQWG